MDNNATSNEEFYVCLHDNATYLQSYSRNKNKCSNPIKSHKRIFKAALVEISMQLSVEEEKLNHVFLIPGQRLCKQCHEKTAYELNAL